MTSTATNHNDQDASGAWANWLWMAHPPSFGAALCLGSGVAGARALSQLFSRVESAEAEPEAIAESWSAETFDLIALDPAGTSASRASCDRLWPVCARLLRPGGCLTLITDNLLWYRWSPGGVRRAFSQIRRARGRARSLRQAGFRTIHRYYMTPSASEPHSFIPVNRRAVAGYESVTTKLSSRGTLRGHLGRAGLHPVLYPSILHLAYR